MASDVRQNYVQFFDNNDVLLAMIWHHLAIDSDYFRATTKQFVTLSNYSATKTIYYYAD